MYFNLRKQEITCVKKQLNIQIQGKLLEVTRKDKLRILLYFESESQNRIVPLPCNYHYSNSEKNIDITINETIQLPYIFYENIDKDCNVYLTYQYGMESGEFIALIAQPLDKNLFDRKTSMPSLLQRGIQWVLFTLCLLCFPILLLDGILAYLGLYERMPKESRSTGIKAVVKHINARIYQITNITLSVRENKCNYLARKYEAYKKDPFDETQILFLSERTPEENGNLNRIKQQLEKTKNYRIVEYINEKTVSQLSLLELREIAKLIATSKLVILDDFYPQIHFLNLRNETKLIQLWHACGAFKTFGFSRVNKIGGPKESSQNHRSYDYVFVSSEKLIDIYSEGFAIPKSHIVPLGVPRTDQFFDETYKEQTKERLRATYQQLTNKKIILFAPTFRGDGNQDGFYPAEQFDYHKISEQLPHDTVVIVKYHPFIKKRQSAKEYSNLIDLTEKESVNDLLLVADLLITDYSSVVFEAALLEIPMIFYAYDLEQYMEQRDIYYDYKQFVPGPIVTTQEELIESLTAKNKPQNRLKSFKDYFMGAIHGHSTEEITDFIQALMKK